MKIRFLNRDDAGEWLRLRLEALSGDAEAFGASLEEYQSLGLEEVAKRLWSDGDAFVVGAFQNRCLIAVAGFRREKGIKTRHKGHVWGVYVTPAHRGEGIGRRIMDEVVRRARTVEGVEQLLLSVASTQIAASRLYRSIGFVPYGLEPRALKVAGRFIDEEHLMLRLKNDAQS